MSKAQSVPSAALFATGWSDPFSGPVAVYPLIKRVFDFFGALILLLAMAPLLIAVSLLVARDGGPVFYSQLRLGRNGKVFKIWKFRSMVPDADQMLAAHLANDPAARIEWDTNQKLRVDPRITAIGRLLRKYSIDEFPQLYNVLVGDMSLVGPRPMFPEQHALYPGRAYFRLRPGMTGLWQVSKRNTSSFAERAVFDTRYAETVSLRTDFVTLLMTVLVVLRGTGC